MVDRGILIKNGISGILTEVGNARNFADAIEQIAFSKEYAKSLGKEALKIRYSHSEDEILAQYFQYIMSRVKKNEKNII